MNGIAVRCESKSIKRSKSELSVAIEQSGCEMTSASDQCRGALALAIITYCCCKMRGSRRHARVQSPR